MRAVLDASAFLDDALYGRPHGVTEIEAPGIADFEVTSVVRQWELNSGMPTDDARGILEAWHVLVARRHEFARLRDRIWYLRHAITTSDASYVALAEALGIPLVTTDLRLARAAERYCDVVIPD